MARNYQSIEEWELYVPGIDKGNERSLFIDGSEDAITMEISHLSRIDLKKYQKAADRVAKSGNNVTDSDEDMIRNMFSKCVRNIKNYSMGDKQIETGSDLFDYGEQDLILDVTMALISRQSLDRGLAKKLKSQFVGKSSQATSKETGIVQDAINLSAGNVKAIYRQVIPNSDSATEKSG